MGALGIFNRINPLRRTRERYQRPHTYNIPVGLLPVCVAPNRQRSPVKTFLVQSDINNGGVINVGDASASLFNGVQLDPGRAWIFSVGADSLTGGSLYPTPMQWAEAVQAYGEAQPKTLDSVEIFIDIADFYAVGDIAGPQNLRIFWSTIATA